MRRAPAGQRGSTAPGQVLQTYSGLMTVSDFTFTSASYVASGFPTNSTFVKISPTSLLDISLNADFTTAASGMPDSIYLGLFVDGSLEEGINHNVSLPNTFTSISFSYVRGLRDGEAPLAAGSHTYSVRVATNNSVATTIRTSTSVDLEIIEFEPVF